MALLRDALRAVQRAERLLEDYRPTLAQLIPAMRQLAPLASTIGQVTQDHSRVALDLRIMRLRLQAQLPEEEIPADPDKTPVDGGRLLSQQLAAVRDQPGPPEPKKR